MSDRGSDDLPTIDLIFCELCGRVILYDENYIATFVDGGRQYNHLNSRAECAGYERITIADLDETEDIIIEKE